MMRSSFAMLAAMLLASVQAFQCRPGFPAGRSVATSTQLHVFGFLNEGKKALVKSLAGEYDQVAIQARIQGLVDESPVLMLSFTT